MFKVDSEKAKEPDTKLSTSFVLLKKQESSKKTSTSLWTMPNPLTEWITTNWKILQVMGIPDHPTCFLRNLYPGKRQQLEPDMERRTDSKLGKEYVKDVYCHPAYLTTVQSASCKMPGWVKIKLESRLPEEISIISDMQMTPPLWQKAKKN